MYQYPYGNAQQLNLDWLMEQWQEVKQTIDGSLQGEIDRVENAINDLLAARDAAVAASQTAQTAASAAAQSAQDALTSEQNAAQSAQTAAQERANAAQAALNAQGSASTAGSYASSAQNAAGQAAVSASQASASASAAHADAQSAAQDAADAHTDALAAAQDADDAHTDALAAQAVLDSIPDDYTLLSDTVQAISSPYITDWFNMDNDNMDSIGQSTASNLREPWVHKNRCGTKGKSLSGSTYYSYLISGSTPKYVGTTFNSIIQTLTADDFTPIEIANEYALSIEIKYKGRGLRNNTHVGGGIVFATYDTDTQTVIGAPVIGAFGVTRQGENIYKHIDFNIDIGAYLPQIYTTKNIAIVYQTRSPDIEEEFIIQPQLIWVGWGSSRYVGNYEKPIAIQSPSFIALQNYAVNDFLIVGYNLYKVTQAIATGEAIVPNTNCVYTTLGKELTSILNS